MENSELIGFLATRKPDESRQFYREILGLKPVHEDDFAIVFDSEGSMLRIQKLKEYNPPKHTALGWEVPDIGTAVSRLRDRGISFIRYEGMNQDPQNIWISPAGARVAWFEDPDGNILSLTQFKRE